MKAPLLRRSLLPLFLLLGSSAQLSGAQESDTSAVTEGANLTVYDKYSDTADYGEMKQDQLEKWRKYAASGGGYLFLLSWTLTSNKPPLTAPIETLAAEANGKLPGVLRDQIVDKGATKPNIVYIDFVNATTTLAIIRYNFPAMAAQPPG